MSESQNRYAALAAPDDGQTGPRPATTSQHPQPSCAKRPTPKPVTVTIVGSSIVRGVALLVHGNDCDASGYVYPGRTARPINAQIKHIPSSDVTVIAAGTNNIDSQPLGQCKEEIRQIIDNVSCKRRDKIVIMSRIPPRHDKPSLNKKIHEVNDFIVQQVKQRLNWHILIHDLSRTDFKKSGLHFNEIGVEKYAHEIRHLLRIIDDKWGFATEEPVLDFTHARFDSAVSPIANQFSSTQPMCDVLSRYVRKFRSAGPIAGDADGLVNCFRRMLQNGEFWLWFLLCEISTRWPLYYPFLKKPALIPIVLTVLQCTTYLKCWV